MSGPALALVVCAAVLHATWNALAKRADHQFAFLWSSVSLAALLLLPIGLWRLPAEPAPASGLPFVAASVGIHALYFLALGRSYRYGDFSRVYPMARGLGVALVPLIALPVFGERLSWLGSLGVGSSSSASSGSAGIHRWRADRPEPPSARERCGPRSRA